MRLKKRIGSALSVLVVVVLCACTGFILLKNIRAVQAYFTRLPYEVQGYPQGDVLLIGSSTMEYWRSSEADLGPLHTVNVGVGGTVVKEWKDQITKMVTPFAPRAVVLYVGSNDISGEEDSKSGEDVAAELDELFAQLHRELPGVPLYYISITPSLKRQHVWNEAERCNKLVTEMAAKDGLLTFVDCTRALSNEDGSPKNDIFVFDGLHLNAKGYSLWTQAVRSVLVDELGEETEVA